MWGLRGEPLAVPAAGQDRRIPVFGALDALTGRLTTHIADRKNSKNFLIFLARLLRGYPERHIFLFLDNSSIHHAKAVARFIADHKTHLTIVWNAEYAPELNLIERYWKHLKEKAIHNYFFGSVEALETAIREAVHHLNRSKELRMTVHLDFLKALRKSA